MKLDVLSRSVEIIDARGKTKILPLCAKEFFVLKYLLDHPGQELSRIQITQAIWPNKPLSNSNILDVYVSRLRAKLGGDRIKNIRGFGYVMEQEN